MGTAEADSPGQRTNPGERPGMSSTDAGGREAQQEHHNPQQWTMNRKNKSALHLFIVYMWMSAMTSSLICPEFCL